MRESDLVKRTKSEPLSVCDEGKTGATRIVFDLLHARIVVFAMTVGFCAVRFVAVGAVSWLELIRQIAVGRDALVVR